MSGGISASSVGTASLFAQGAGALASAYGAYTKSRGEQAAYEYQAKVAENNAVMARWQAEDATKRGQTAVMSHQLKVAALRGTQRASLAARGVDIGEGSALDILSGTDLMGTIDANTITDNAAKEAWAYRNQAANYTGNAALLKMRADNESPFGAAAGSLLTGAGSVASSWYRMTQTGLFSTGSKSKPYATGSFDFPSYA